MHCIFSPEFKMAIIHCGGLNCYCKNQFDIRFLCVCPVIDDKLHHDIVRVAVEIMSRKLEISSANFVKVMMQFIIKL